MASLSEIQKQFAVMLHSVAPDREIVQGRRGEGAEPGRPFVMWTSDVIALPARPTVRHAPNSVTVGATSRVEFAVSFDGGDAMGDAQAFGLCWWLPQRFLDIFAAGGGLLGITGPNDLSNAQLARYQTRADMRVVLSANLETTAAATSVDHSCVTVVEQPHDYEETFCIDSDGGCPNGGR